MITIYLNGGRAVCPKCSGMIAIGECSLNFKCMDCEARYRFIDCSSLSEHEIVCEEMKN